MKNLTLNRKLLNKVKMLMKLATGACTIKLFTAYPRVEHLKGASLGQAPGLPANIRLGWRGLLGTNTLAYYENL
jgi:hypothetical protein